MSLTIAIPTYNRNNKLFENLEKVLPLVENEKIVIVDNCSDIPVEETLRPLLKQFPGIDIKIFRNKTNVGLLANFLRCFEYCETEWMWLLSDDDTPYTNCLQIIRRDIKAHADYVFINYASSMVEKDVPYALCVRDKSFSTTGVVEFIRKMDSFVNVIFISSGVYNIKKVLPGLKIGYTYSFSLAPHIATVMASLGDTEKALFSADKLVNFIPPAAKDTWSQLTFCQGVNLIMEIPIEVDDLTYITLFEKVNAWYLSDAQIYSQVATTYTYSVKKRQNIFIQLISRAFLKKRSLREKLKIVYYIAKLHIISKRRFSDKKYDTRIDNKHPLHRL